ncbi:RNA polymerase III-inhibiting protein maf1 [Rhizopus azygosporus]|uniref:Repressor of RNA polymerase III transcription MAF1 n=1 Tax=Rhizopus azygosporus TaxID=86630 RepID=A0A367JIV3_RHIAZ|nr:RNA polymerase III-inhibiting protein maf1 [Rhizopus azygosporus]
MKFLEVNSLEVINSALSWETSECILTGRVEAYSCKSAGTDKKLFKTLEQRYNTLAPGSISPDDIQVVSPFGRLTESTPRKTFFYLLATLNAAFPDNDFENVRPDQFIKMPSVEMVMNSVNTTLFNLGNDVVVNQYRLWDVLDEIVQLNECDVYTYNPDADDDPMNDEDGYLWSVNYFFFNRKLKRMIFFSIKSESLNAPIGQEEGELRQVEHCLLIQVIYPFFC